MKRKLLIAALSAAFILACAAGFSACDESEKTANEHSLVRVAATDPTCTEAGNSIYWYCSDCGKYFADEAGNQEIAKDSWIIPALAHDNMQYFPEQKATCTQAGNSAYWACPDCGKYFADDSGMKEIEKDSWVLPALAHGNMQQFPAKDPTCTDSGNIAYWACPDCGLFFADAAGVQQIEKDSWVLSALGHADREFFPAEAQTCTESGNIAYWHCLDCGEYFADEECTEKIEEGDWVLPALGHENMVYVPEQAATCTQAGNSAYWRCPDCGLFFADEHGDTSIEADSWVMPALGHKNMVYVPEQAATCTETGCLAHWYCPDCDTFFLEEGGYNPVQEEQLILPARGHERMKVYPAVAATCTSAGNTTYYHCYDCGGYFADVAGEQEIEKNSWVLPALGHPHMTYIPAKAETCEENGNTAYYYCPDCGRYFADAEGKKFVIEGSWVILAHHTFAEEWSKDETSHWHAATCGHDRERADVGTHTFFNLECTVCGYRSEYTEGLLYTLLDGGTAYAVSGMGEGMQDTQIVIPALYRGLPVTAIADNAFKGCSQLESVTLPDSITSIGAYAFSRCTALKGIVIPEGVLSIGVQAFGECVRLESVVYNAENCADLTVFDEVFLEGGRSAGEGFVLQIGAGVKRIPDYMFTATGSPFISQIIFAEDGVCSDIGDYTFRNSYTLTSLRIPESVTSIGKEAFRGCTSLENIYFPEGITFIGDEAFSECGRLARVDYNVKDPASFESSVDIFEKSGANAAGGITFNIGTAVKAVPAYIFSSNYGAYVSEVNFAQGGVCESIGDYAFGGNNLLEEIVLPEGIVNIGQGAFLNCTLLERITIPESVSVIGPVAFSGCVRVVRVDFLAAECADFSEKDYVFGDAGIEGEGVTVYIGENVRHIPGRIFFVGSIAANIDAPKITEVIFAENSACTSIGEKAFARNALLENIVLPAGLTSLGASAFEECVLLKSISIPEGIGSIADSAFRSCTSLAEVLLPENLTSIGESAFRDCTSLADILLPENLTSIGGSAFRGCTALKDPVLPEGLLSVGDYAFNDCTRIERIVLPDSLTDLGVGAFNGCSTLRTLVIGAALSELKAYTFLYCTSLTELSIPDTVKSIGQQAFYGCTSLIDVYVPETVELVGEYAFGNCTSLVTAEVRSVIDVQSARLFSGCESLKSVTLSNVSRLVSSSFYNCMELEEIVYEGTMEEWNAISKEENWDYLTGNFVVRCTDGVIEKEQSSS